VSIRVLIVDDHSGFRAAARDLLLRRGYAVVGEADSAQAAYDAVAGLAPNAVLLDLRLGQEHGCDVARELTTRWQRLAVVLTSSDGAGITASRVRACGARGFVAKHALGKADLGALWGEWPS
jgi:DNA-binding NarL/FixJ family response regulator